MSKYYNPRLSPKYTYDPRARAPFKISRSKIDLFLSCPRCFYLDRRLGIRRPPGYPFALNSAVDTLLKKEFDVHRVNGSRHPIMEEYGVDAVPFEHPKMDMWRDNFKGVQYLHPETNLIITGAIDDLWKDASGQLVVVDYKSTAKDGEVGIDADWQISYKRQMEVYQWLLRRNEFAVSNTGYFVYCNGNTDAQAFDKKIEFDITLHPYEGDDSWVEGTIRDLHACLGQSALPKSDPDCDYCLYRKETALEEK